MAYVKVEELRERLYDSDTITFKGLAIIDTFPTADVVEVKHGEWIDDGDCFHCSACQKTYQLGSLQTIYDVKRCWKYCANCGAKMDGGVNDG